MHDLDTAKLLGLKILEEWEAPWGEDESSSGLEREALSYQDQHWGQCKRSCDFYIYHSDISRTS